MEKKMSVWKRVGGWLRGSMNPLKDPDAVKIDAEGLLVPTDPLDDPHASQDEHVDEVGGGDLAHDEAHNGSLARSSREEQLEAVEEGFNRLVQVLDSINDNISTQRESHEQLLQRLDRFPELIKDIPQAIGSQREMMVQLSEELRQQALRHQQLAEQITSLPDLTQQQVHKLSDIEQRLSDTAEHHNHVIESFNRFDLSTQDVLSQSKAQNLSLDQLNKSMQKSERWMQQMLDEQKRRFKLLIIVIAAIGAIALGGIAVALWLMTRGG